MLVETKARVGVFAIALGAYLPQFPSLVPEFQSQYQTFKTMIPDSVELIDGGIVTTKELAQQAGDKFRAADVDLVILQLLTYATSYNMLPAVRDLDVPVVLVNVQKLRAPDYGWSSSRRSSTQRISPSQTGVGGIGPSKAIVSTSYIARTAYPWRRKAGRSASRSTLSGAP